jgi:hypothetical protein
MKMIAESRIIFCFNRQCTLAHRVVMNSIPYNPCHGVLFRPGAVVLTSLDANNPVKHDSVAVVLLLTQLQRQQH